MIPKLFAKGFFGFLTRANEGGGISDFLFSGAAEAAGAGVGAAALDDDDDDDDDGFDFDGDGRDELVQWGQSLIVIGKARR